VEIEWPAKVATAFRAAELVAERKAMRRELEHLGRELAGNVRSIDDARRRG
jgi:hypothetical protein